VADSNTKESSPVTNDDDIDAIRETSLLPDIEIEDIEGIGPTTAKKLKEAGIVSVLHLGQTRLFIFSWGPFVTASFTLKSF
jgi:DNA repair protein RadA